MPWEVVFREIHGACAFRPIFNSSQIWVSCSARWGIKNRTDIAPRCLPCVRSRADVGSINARPITEPQPFSVGFCPLCRFPRLFGVSAKSANCADHPSWQLLPPFLPPFFWGLLRVSKTPYSGGRQTQSWCMEGRKEFNRGIMLAEEIGRYDIHEQGG